MPVPVPALLLGGGFLAGLLLLNKREKAVASAGKGGVLPQAPTAGTAAFDQPVIPSAVAIPPNAPPQVQMDAAVANMNAAIANPAPLTAVQLAAQQSGVSVTDLEAAARFMGVQSGNPSFTAAQFVAMGPSPRDITDAVFQMKSASGTLPQ